MILALYERSRLDHVGRIQETLHEIQKSPHGWQLAQILMSRTQPEIKFFGASTMVIKLNRDREVEPCTMQCLDKP